MGANAWWGSAEIANRRHELASRTSVLEPKPIPPIPDRMVMTYRLPDFAIVGAKRSGTSTLFSLLTDHPQVYESPKEIHFFDHNFKEGVAWYSSFFEGAEPGQIAGEATQTYMFDPKIPELMARTTPETRLIAILRDPVRRAFSDHRYAVARGLEDLSFEEAIDREERRASQSYEGFLTKSYVQRGKYFDQLTNLFDHYPRERVHIVLFEDLSSSPEGTFRDLCRFLEIDDQFVPARVDREVNPTLNFRSLRLREWSQNWGLVGKAIGRINRKRATGAVLDASIANSLAREYESSNRALATLLGRDLAEWTWPSTNPGQK